eukprot:1152232-Rhodomonas_salina.2
MSGTVIHMLYAVSGSLFGVRTDIQQLWYRPALVLRHARYWRSVCYYALASRCAGLTSGILLPAKEYGECIESEQHGSFPTMILRRHYAISGTDICVALKLGMELRPCYVICDTEIGYRRPPSLCKMRYCNTAWRY